MRFTQREVEDAYLKSRLDDVLLSTSRCSLLTAIVVALPLTQPGHSEQMPVRLVCAGFFLAVALVMCLPRWHLSFDACEYFVVAAHAVMALSFTQGSQDWSRFNNIVLALALDCVITLSHLSMRIRWVTSLASDMIFAVAFALHSYITLGDEVDIITISATISAFLALMIGASVGLRCLESSQRTVFSIIICERTRRAAAEFAAATKQDDIRIDPSVQELSENNTSETSLCSAALPALVPENCSRRTFLRCLLEAADQQQLKGTLYAALHLIEEARGGMLVVIADKKSFRQVFSPRKVTTISRTPSKAQSPGPDQRISSNWSDITDTSGQGGSFTCSEVDDSDGDLALRTEDALDSDDFEETLSRSAGFERPAQAALRTCDGGYMTNRLQGFHISSPTFIDAVRDFTEHSKNDRWPTDHRDDMARGQPKDGALLLDPNGFRIKCAVKVLGLQPSLYWRGIGTRHEAALACASAVPECIAFKLTTEEKDDDGIESL